MTAELTGTHLDVAAARIRHRNPCTALALSVVRDGEVRHALSGFADLASAAPVTENTAFRIASITKTLTAIAIMQLREQGRIDLDAPANRYLRSYQVAGPRPNSPPITVRSLLTHTSGLPEVLSPRDAIRPDFGESFPPGRAAPSLAEFYGGTLQAAAEPGQVFTYTNHGPATLGQIVEDLTGRGLRDYLRENVFEPCGMTSTDLSQSRRPAADRATGYRLTRTGPQPVGLRDMVTAGADAAWSTPADLGRYAAMLLAGGAGRAGRVLSADSLAEMFGPQYQPDARLPGVGLGFFRADVGGHPVVEHQGIIPGFDANLLLSPADGIAVVALTTGARLGMFWLPAESTRVLAEELGVTSDGIGTDIPQQPQVWPQICGFYQLPGSATDIRKRSVVGAGLQVLVRRGQLTLRCLHPVPALWRGMQLHPDSPDDPYVFRFDLSDDGLGTTRVAFAPDPADGRMAMHLEVMPLTAYRRR